MSWYKVGTVSVTAGSNAVIGVGTSFIANVRVGDGFRGPDGAWYEVNNVASDTALSIATGYLGSTVAGGSYSIIPVQGYIKDSADQLRAATKTLSPAVISEKARALLARPDTAGMQAELALVPVTSASDSTAQRLLTVGYGGIGYLNNTPFVGVGLNPDSYRTGGFSVWGQFVITGYATATGFLSTYAADANNLFQSFVNGANGARFERVQSAGVFGAWTPAISTNNATLDPALGTGGLMSSTVVSGWTVTKYLNGDMFASASLGNSAVVPVNAVSQLQITIPSGFVGAVYPLVQAQPAGNADAYGVVFTYFGSATALYYGLRNGAAVAQQFLITVSLKGRWKT